MAIAGHHHKSPSEGKLWGLCPFWKSGTASSSSPSTHNLHNQNSIHQNGGVASNARSSNSVSSVVRSLLPTRRRLRLDPANNLYFPCHRSNWAIDCGLKDILEAHKDPLTRVVHVRSAVRIKNISRSRVAFKFQTTAPKSCYMRPPGGILAPGESLIATVFKFMEHPEKDEKLLDQNSKVKFKIMSLKVKEGMDYVSELFDERKDQVTVERVLRAVFLDVERSTPELEKLKRQLAEAEAALEAHKKPLADTGPRVVGEGLVIDEWKERREKYLARQQVEAVDSV